MKAFLFWINFISSCYLFLPVNINGDDVIFIGNECRRDQAICFA